MFAAGYMTVHRRVASCSESLVGRLCPLVKGSGPFVEEHSSELSSTGSRVPAAWLGALADALVKVSAGSVVGEL